MSDPARSCTLDPKKARALDLRMMGMSWGQIAEELAKEGIDQHWSTYRRWSLGEDWIAEYNARRAEIDRATQEAQTGLVELAYGALRDVLTSPTASHEARLSAADKALKYLGPAIKTEVSVSGTTAALEAELEQLRAARGG